MGLPNSTIHAAVVTCSWQGLVWEGCMIYMALNMLHNVHVRSWQVVYMLQTAGRSTHAYTCSLAGVVESCAWC